MTASREGKESSDAGVLRWKGEEDIAVSSLSCPPSLNTIVLIAMGFLSWNSFTSSGAFTLSAGSQLSWAWEYPFHHRRYCNFFHRPCLLEVRTSSTSYSGLLSIRSGGGSGKFSPCSSVSLYGVRSDAWKALKIFQCGGSSRQYTTGDITLMILKGPLCHVPSFAVGCDNLRFMFSSQTWSPSWNGRKWCCPFFLSQYFIVSHCAL
jgi:hypothetical protein